MSDRVYSVASRYPTQGRLEDVGDHAKKTDFWRRGLLSGRVGLDGVRTDRALDTVIMVKNDRASDKNDCLHAIYGYWWVLARKYEREGVVKRRGEGRGGILRVEK